MSDADEIANLKAEVARLTSLVDNLYRHLGIGQLGAAGLTADQPSPEVVEAIRSGNLIVAIKLWRERTGLGLAEAKREVENLARSMGY